MEYLTFEGCINIINEEIAKKSSRWTLRAIPSIDYDDVSQIIRIHIFKKWPKFDQTKPLRPWLSRLINNQITNLVRNYYSNFSRPCLKCCASQGNDLCSLYGKQCTDCNLYKKWVFTKKRGCDVKLPLSIDACEGEIHQLPCKNQDMELETKDLHKRIKTMLTKTEWEVYEMLYLEHLDKEVVAERMGYKTSESGRAKGYKRIKELEKIFVEKARRILYE